MNIIKKNVYRMKKMKLEQLSIFSFTIANSFPFKFVSYVKKKQQKSGTTVMQTEYWLYII